MQNTHSKTDPNGAMPVEFRSHPNIVFCRIKKVCEIRQTGKSTVYSDTARGVLTKPVRLGPKLSVWPAYEVFAINAAVTAGKSDDELRELVKRLEAARATLGCCI